MRFIFETSIYVLADKVVFVTTGKINSRDVACEQALGLGACFFGGGGEGVGKRKKQELTAMFQKFECLG